MWINTFKIFVLSIFFFALAVKADNKDEKEGKYRLDSIVIKGSTNISHFTLYYSQDIAEKYELQNSGDYEFADTSRLVFSIPVEEFFSDKTAALNGFMKLIKAETFEFINIAIFRKDLYRILSRKKTYIIPLRVTIAGETAEYISPVNIKIYDETVTVMGEVDILLTDFDLELPRKLFGLIKIENAVQIDFKISFTE
jgi:hypothetical protein